MNMIIKIFKNHNNKNQKIIVIKLMTSSYLSNSYRYNTGKSIGDLKPRQYNHTRLPSLDLNMIIERQKSNSTVEVDSNVEI